MLSVTRLAQLPRWGGSVLAPVVRSVPRWQSGVRVFSQDARSGFARHAERRKAAASPGLKESLQAPATGRSFQIGQGALAGAATVGLGALCFYGLGLAHEPGAVEKRLIWPEHVKERIRHTYLYFGGSIGLTAASALAVFRTPALLNLAMRQGMVALGVSIAAMIGSGMLVRSIPYENTGPKHLAWLLHSGVMGLMVAPLCLLGGPILTRAAWYTAGMVGGLSTVAACAPSDKFLYMGGPLAMGLGVVLVSSIGSAFMPPTTALGAGMYSIALYGGLILFGGFLLYDTQKIMHRAEHHPPMMAGVRQYDPINASIGIYMDTMNIFIRIAQILAMSGGSRRK
ncbi:hypothetical protein TCAL_14954 [Tigriopus californicus]|uniref:Growth hormone-inducible transmembrane protein n=1 Tax=Tigriopus californicus TaxID=6832 RepID=A0A553N9M5_TIGCA|nr:growth hormone-inducible transmembrane protein-like [Tigriopus californicus]TRY62142.1 hypothetical protein TCAL_14954 [Tigriopus californicus]